jgi:Methyltransferase domain
MKKSNMAKFFERIRRAIQGPPQVSTSFESDVRAQLAIIADRNSSCELLKLTEERTRTLEHLLLMAEQRARSLERILSIVEERSRTLEYLANQVGYANRYQIEFLHKFYVEAFPLITSADTAGPFNSNQVPQLETEYPIAFDSRDHVSPDSTTEGIVRPTLFVQDCIKVLGKEIKSLDLGTGAAGIVFEFLMNGVMAVGIDGSDFCRKNKIGYWPLLPGNLFTCDITKPFSFLTTGDQSQFKFDVITMWEVLEHLEADRLKALFQNVTRHLSTQGYFIGSVSLVEYNDAQGNPYHLTLKPREWWRTEFERFGLDLLDEHPFIEKTFPRGNGPRYQDFHNYHYVPEDGFFFVARKVQPLLPLAQQVKI